MATIKDYLDNIHAHGVSYLNLDIDFSKESFESISAFCDWLRTHPCVTQISFQHHKSNFDAPGTNLSLVPPIYITQIFAAISDNPHVNMVHLPQCYLSHITDTTAIAAIQKCLEKKPKVSIIGNDSDTWLTEHHSLCESILVAIFKGESTDIRLQHVFSEETSPDVAAEFFNAISIENEKIFQHVSLSHNSIDMGLREPLVQLLTLRATSIDLSHNPIGAGAIVDDWRVFLTAVKQNTQLTELSLKNCNLCDLAHSERDSGDTDTEIATPLSDREAFEALLIEFIRTTHLSIFDISMNDWSIPFMDSLIEAANHNPNLKLVCGHPNEGWVTIRTQPRNTSSYPGDALSLLKFAPSDAKKVPKKPDIDNDHKLTF